MPGEIKDSETNKIIKKFFDEFGLVSHQISSYNHFIQELTHRVIAQFSSVQINHSDGKFTTMKFSGLSFSNPSYTEVDNQTITITPIDCFNRKISYLSSMFVDIEVIKPDGEKTFHKKVFIGKIPVMVGSCLCNISKMTDEQMYKIGEDPYNVGGTFIISGMEKVVIAQERSSFNGPYCFKKRKDFPCFEYYIEVRSSAANGAHTTTTQIGMLKDNKLIIKDVKISRTKLYVIIPYIPETNLIPIGILFKAFGVIKEEDIIQYILGNDKENEKYLEYLYHSLEQSYPCRTTEDALCFIGKRGAKKKKKTKSKDGENSESDSDEDGKKDKGGDLNEAEFEEPEMAEEVPDVELPELDEVAEDAEDEVLEDDEGDDLEEPEEDIEEDDLEDSDKEEKEDNEKKNEDTKEAKERKAAISYALHLLNVEFLPHVGNNNTNKLLYIGDIILRLIKIYYARDNHKGPQKWDEVEKELLEDRDHFKNKRIDTVGSLMHNMFYTGWKKLRTDCKLTCERNMKKSTRDINPISLLKPTIMINKMIKCFKSGNWGDARSAKASKKNGISQPFEKYNYNGGLSNLRKISTPIEAQGKIIEPRRLHSSGINFICPADTPEGKSCGLVKSLALGAIISNGYEISEIYEILKDKIIETMTTANSDKCRVILNGSWIGVLKDGITPDEFYSYALNLKRSFNINPETSVIINRKSNYVKINTDGGRLLTPMFVVNNGKLAINDYVDENGVFNLNIDWNEFLKRGIIEFIDPEEQDQSHVLIANYPSEVKYHKNKNYTHCTLHPRLGFSIGASTVPFANHNQSPRNTYQSAMSKQSMGTPYHNMSQIMSENFHYLHYTQRPLAYSKSLENIGYTKLPSGMNVIVGIIPFTGFNQEDSVILNQSSVDRGLFRSTHVVSYYFGSENLDEKDKSSIIFEIPNPSECRTNKGTRTDHLDSNGLVRVGQIVRKGDILIGITKSTKDSMFQKKKINMSICFDDDEIGQVDKIQKGVNADCYEYVRVRINVLRIPEIGDKFSSRHGQKGTCGIMYRQEDMPFNAQGITPDIIINALAIPSRMTIGQLIECTLGKKMCVPNDNLYKKLDNYEEEITKEIESIKSKASTKTSKNNNSKKEMIEKEIAKKKEKATTIKTLLTKLMESKQKLDKNIKKELIEKVNAQIKISVVKAKDLLKEIELLKVDLATCDKTHAQALNDKVPSEDTPEMKDYLRSKAIDNINARLRSTLTKNNNNYPKNYAEGDATPFVGTTELDKITYEEFKAQKISLDPNNKFDFEKWEKLCPDNTYVREIIKTLHENGYEWNCNERLYNGMTGEMMDASVFMGPTFYQRLRHMVCDKIHSRARGPKQLLTRQPLEGRSQDGGLRVGEMERDNLIGQGASGFLKDRLFYNSDKYKCSVCNICGWICIDNIITHDQYCKACKVHGEKSKTSLIHIPYATKLLFQELIAMNILPRIIV
jgi:DNA-directed RNA polymerase beta subunit